MNLEEIRRYKKSLKMQRYLCFAMACFMTLGLYGNLKRKNGNFAESSIENDIVLLNDNDVEVEATFNKPKILNYPDTKTILRQEIIEAEDLLDSMTPEVVETTPAELTYEEKMAYICERDGYTYEELDAVCAGCVAESYGDGNCYDECYDLASIFYNRTHSNAYAYDVNKIFGDNAGYSIYYQFIAPNQFSVYAHGSYKKYLGRIDLLGYQAAIDMFYSGIPSHNYLNFNNVPPKNGSYIQLNPPYGNYFYRAQSETDRIDDAVVRQRVMS